MRTSPRPLFAVATSVVLVATVLVLGSRAARHTAGLPTVEAAESSIARPPLLDARFAVGGSVPDAGWSFEDLKDAPVRQGGIPARTERPVDVFAALDGVWEGEFVGWSAGGEARYRIRVRQEYETVDDHTQTVRIRDVGPDGTATTGEGENTAHRADDGSLELRCEVRKSTGEVVSHRGRLGTGPSGEKVLFWTTREDGRVETFREWVAGEGPDAVYRIEGAGRYGETTFVMAGAYRRPR